MFDEKVLEKSGLTLVEVKDNGEQILVGTDAQWTKATRLQTQVDQLTDDEVDELLNEEIDER